MRTLFECIAPLLIEGTLEFDADELRIRGSNVISFSDTRIKGRGEDETLEYVYSWPKKKHSVGLSFETLHSCLSATSPNDAVSFIVTEQNQHAARPYIVVRIENDEQNYSYEHRIYLLMIEQRHEIEDSQLEDFKICLSIPSSLFLKVLRNSAKRAEDVQVYTKRQDDQQRIFFRSSGDEAELLFSLGFDTDQKELKECPKLDVYSLKYLLLITKATNLSSTVKIYLRDEHFLAVQYSIGLKSSVLFCLAPQVDRAADCPSDSVFVVDDSRSKPKLVISNFKRPVKRKRRKTKSNVVQPEPKIPKTQKAAKPKQKRPVKSRKKKPSTNVAV